MDDNQLKTGATTEVHGGLIRLGARRSLRREATEVLRRSIVLGDLVPGTLYSVAQLADSLGTSRTPVREALLELASRGMVQFEQNRGVRVVPTSIDDLRDMFEVRFLLEIPATRRAVMNASEEAVAEMTEILEQEARAGNDKYRLQELDRAFHRTLLMQAGNQTLVELVDRLRDMVLVRQASHDTDITHDFSADHRAILACVRAGDADGAAAAVRRHLEVAATIISAMPGFVDSTSEIGF
ncbi:MAG: GntR family transcriptional regulator [Actinobacteria bacterium]|nr:GntR family transcriptional regulator [Actinomycetota bacterium]